MAPFVMREKLSIRPSSSPLPPSSLPSPPEKMPDLAPLLLRRRPSVRLGRGSKLRPRSPIAATHEMEKGRTVGGGEVVSGTME